MQVYIKTYLAIYLDRGNVRMVSFENLTPTNGFDFNDLNNARQNNYAWSMSELGDYIYVGTGRNIPLNIISAVVSGAQVPTLIKPDPIDNRGEIWRYRKDGSLPWERVYKAPAGSGIIGFRYMITHRPFGGNPCLYAATLGPRPQILKSTNGVNWFILSDTVLQGTSSRAMVSHKGKIYMSTVSDISDQYQNSGAFLYSSVDPEYYPWESLIDPNAPGFNPRKNPTGPISNMAVFNNRLYVAVSNQNGAQVWRTNGPVPKLNDWTLIVDEGFGDPANVFTLAMGVFKDHLYVSATKTLPLSWLIPRGCDIIRINKCDEWDLIVGGSPLWSGRESLSGLGSGFNNPFNVYAWQIQEHKGKLLISTFDDSSNMQLILDTLLTNREALEERIGSTVTNILIGIYRSIVEILDAIRYPIGFDLYTSRDGINFDCVFLDGLKNRNNYGGRILYQDSCKDLYLGTANPFEGCEVWKACHKDWRITSCDDDYYKGLLEISKIIDDNFDIMSENMHVILDYLPKEDYGVLHQFV